MSSNRADLDLMIQTAGILDPRLKASERRARIVSLAAVAGVSDDTIYNHVKRIKAGLPTRKPRADAGQIRVLAPEVQDAARAMFINRRFVQVSTALIGEQLRHQFPEEKISDASLRRLRETTLAERERWAKVYTRMERSRPNEEWMIDSTPTDCFLLSPKSGKPVRVDLTVCTDACTRSIMYARMAAATPYMEIAGILHHSIRKQSDQWPQSGIPEMLTVDWGKVFMSSNLEAALVSLGIERNPSHPYYPEDKGKVERCIGTINHGFIPLLPGFCGRDNQGDNRVRVGDGEDLRQIGEGAWVDKRDGRPLLTIPQANELLWQWIVGTYHQHTIRTIGMTPLQAWLANPPVAHTYKEEYLEQAFLARKTPTVRNGKIHCLNFDYYAPELVGCNGLKVEVRYDPADIREIYVYGVRKVLVGGQARALPWGRICVARLDSPLLAGTPQAEAELAERRQANRQAEAERRAWEQYYKSNPAAARDLTERLAEAAAAAPDVALPDPTERPDPAIPGLSHEAEAKHESYTIRGVPMIRRAAGQ